MKGVRALRGTTGVSRRRGLEELERPAQVGFERVRKKRAEESRLVARGAVTAPLETRRRTEPRIHRAAFCFGAHTHTQTHSHSCTHGTQIASTDRHDTSMASAVGFFSTPLCCATSAGRPRPRVPCASGSSETGQTGPYRLPVALLAPLAPFSTHSGFLNRDCLQI